MISANDLIASYPSPNNDFKLTFDDNGRVAYAYLKRLDRIVGDVWIYNRCEAPDQPEWQDRTKLPFANPRAYTLANGHMRVPVTLNDIQVIWDPDDSHATAHIYINGDLVASVSEGDKPGYSKFAAKDGPLAKQLIRGCYEL